MKQLSLSLAALFLLTGLISTASADNLQKIAGGPVQVDVIASGMTTNTTSAISNIVPNGAKTFYGEVVCSAGLCTQTQAIFGTNATTNINGVLIGTLTLSGTPRDQNKVEYSGSFPRYYVTPSNTTGTAVTGGVYVNY